MRCPPHARPPRADTSVPPAPMVPPLVPLRRKFARGLAGLALPVALFAQIESPEHDKFPNFDRRAEIARARADAAVNAPGLGAGNGQGKAAREQATEKL